MKSDDSKYVSNPSESTPYDVGKIHFEGCRSFLISRMQSNMVVIDKCTLSEVPAKDQIMLRWRGPAGNADITNGLTISNTIWGHAWDEANSGTYAFKAHNGGISLAATTVNVVNVYTTSQFLFTAGNELPGIPVGNYAGKGSDLWVNPYGGLDFHFRDTAFPGKNDAGDPRWKP